MKRRQRKAFTIIELVAVAMIIALLAVFVVPRAFKGLGKAKHDIAKGKMGIVDGAIARFQYDCGRPPTDEEGLEALLVAPSDLEDKWAGAYCKRSDLEDPWGNPFEYMADGMVNIGSYDLMCRGADGAEGGEGENADIVNE
ncbi:MAG: type II secretion system major pseudopilin GspG [Planctomycetota bacterium]|jgi:general secretion pathway protein G